MCRNAARAVSWHAVWVLPAILVAACLLPDSICRALDHPYSKTEHGGMDVNGDTTTGARRGPNAPVAGYTIDPAKFGPGECIHCHDAHASLGGIGHTPNPAMVFQTPENVLCASCHDQPNSSTFNLPWFVGWAGAQRTSTYAQSKHGMLASGAQWVVGSPYSGNANVLNNNLTSPAAPPGAATVYGKGSCLTCHNPHGYYPGNGGTGLVSPAEQVTGIVAHNLVRSQGSQTGASPAEANALCNYCHDNNQLFGAGGDHSVASKSYWYKGSIGPSATYTGYLGSLHRTSAHTYNLWPGNSTYPARTGEKGQCTNCHDPHGGAAGGNINGAAGGSAPSNRALVAPMIDPNAPTTRNMLCFTCHANIAGSGAQPFRGQAAYQAVKHGNSTGTYWGRTTDPYNNSTTSYSAATAYWGPRSTGDYGLCLNCHNPHTSTVGTATVNGTTTIPKQLIDSYHAGNSTSVTAYNANNHKLCFDCHNATRLTSGGGNTAFPEHGKHINGERALCNDCHNPHAYNSAQVSGSPPAGSRNISFNPSTVTQSSQSVTINGTATRGPVWFYNATVNGTAGRTGCLLTCHGKGHDPINYSPGAAPVQVTSRLTGSPQPTRGATSVRMSLQTGTDQSPPTELEYVVDSARTGAPTTANAEVRSVAPATATGSQRTTTSEAVFDVPTSGWLPRSSHSVYVRAKAPGRTDEPWRGTMLSVTAPGPDAPVVTYYLDERATVPAPTPDGTPTLPRRGVVALRVRAASVRGYRVRIDAPDDANSIDSAALTVLSAGEGALSWPIADGPDAAGRARVTLITQDRRSVAPAAGEYAWIGEAPRNSVHIECTPPSASLNADGKSIARIVARVTDANGLGLASRAVDFRRISGGGTLTPTSPATDPLGAAEASYIAGVTAETAVVEAVDRSTGASARAYVRLRLTGSVSVTLREAGLGRHGARASESLSVLLEVHPARLPADGVSTASVVATVTDARGSPKAGVLMRFEVAGREGHIVASRAATDAAGRADAVYIAGSTPGNVTIVATEPISQAGSAATLTLTGNGAAKVVVQATPSTVPANGRSLSQITVKVTDLLGRPVDGATVSIRTSNGYGSVAVGNPVTNPLGEVTAMFRPGVRSGVETIMAEVLSPMPADSTFETTGRAARMRSRGSPGRRAPDTRPGAATDFAGSTRVGGSRADVSAGSGGLGAFALPTPLVRVLNNMAVSYSRWDDWLTIEGQNVARQSAHLRGESWNLRFKRPMSLGVGGLSLLVNMDNDESQQYGFLTRYTTLSAMLRASGRNYDFMTISSHSRSSSDDLRSGLSTSSRADDILASLTLRPPHLPMINVSSYRASFRNSFGDSDYGVNLNRTNLTLVKQLGPVALQWTSTQATQDQGIGGTSERSTFRYDNAALTLSKGLARGLSVDLTLNRNATRSDDTFQRRSTDQTNTDLQLRFSPASNLLITGSRVSNDVSDSAISEGGFSTTTQALELSYQPARFLALRAGTRSEDAATPAGLSRFSTRHIGGALNLGRRMNLLFTATHTEEPVLLAGRGLRTDSRALQLVTTRLLRGTDLVFGWMKLRSDSYGGTSRITSYSARAESQVTRDVRGSAGVSSSDISGASEGLGYSLRSRTQDLGLVWTPNPRTEVAYTLTRLTQSGIQASSTSTLGLLRLSTVLRGRAYLIVEAADNLLDQAIYLPGGYGTSLRGSRLSIRLNYMLDAGSSVDLAYETTRDDASNYKTRSIRLGHSLLF